MNRVSLCLRAAIATALASCAPSVPPRASAPSMAAPTDTSARAPAHAIRETPDAPWRAHAPSVAAAPAPFTPPPVRSFRLANGIPVRFLEQHVPGLLHVEVMLHAQPAPFGANEMAARSVWLGTPTVNRSKLEVANDAEGSILTSSYGWGWLRIGITATSDRVSASVARLASLVLDASFPAGQYVPYAQRVISDLEPFDETTDAIMARLLSLVLYTTPHPEDDGRDLRSSDLGGLRRDQVADAYDAALDPSSAALAVAGDSTEEALKPILENAFGGWHAKKKRARSPWTKPVLATSSPRLVVVDQPGGESNIAFVGEGPRFSTPDWAALSTLRPIFGGANGRLAGAFRSAKVERNGAALGLDGNPLAPRVTLRAKVAVGQTATALAALDELLRQTKIAAIAPDELARARRLQLLGLQTMTATMAGAADEVEGLVVQALSPEDIPARAALYLALTSGDLQGAGTRYLDPDRMKVVVVGDWSKMRTQLEGLGWGAVELRSSAGAVLGGEGTPAAR